MHRSAQIVAFLAICSLACAGCSQSPFLAGQPAPGAMAPGTAAPGAPAPGTTASGLTQLRDLDRRANALDADNRDLHSEVARVQQEKQLLAEQVTLLQKRLRETSRELEQAQRVSNDVQQQMQTLEASTHRRGGATITANNSLQEAIDVPRIPGFNVRQDGDVVRIEIPADRLFHPHSAQMLPTASYLLDDLANSVTRYFPSQIIGIEAYTDNSSTTGSSPHELTAAQAVAVLTTLVRRNQIPTQQLFVVGHGANHARASNATAAGRSQNRHIELVVYPDKVPGR